jgi:phenylalanyl-tRNA synthetase beta chain
MKVPISWLQEYVDIDMPVEELAERLTLAGLEVASIEYIGVPAGYRPGATHTSWEQAPDARPGATHLVWDREKIVVAEILEVMPHPNADRLVLARVDYGAAEPHVVVTGAPNLYPYKGLGPLNVPLKVVFAREGARLYDGHQDGRVLMTLKGTKIRGVWSDAMVCSEKELGLSDEHEGVIIFPPDAPAAGTPLADYLGDVLFDIDLTPNLARAFSIVGVAREVAALTGRPLRHPPLDVAATGVPIEGQIEVRIEQPELNPRFTAALIEGVKIGPSPLWLQRRLALAGMRPINNVVDATNYVMLELGQPLHAFDYDELERRAHGHAPVIVTRTAQPGETLVTLDGVTRTLLPFTVVVADEAGALGVAGVMGGAESEVRDGTSNILLEAAAWDMINIRRTSAALGLSSEASFRFSRGVHPEMALRGLLRGIEFIRQLAGGEIAQGRLDNYPRPPQPVTLDVTPAEVERILGIALNAVEIAGLLGRLEFHCVVAGDTVHVTAPDHRLDVFGVEDLLEEIARIYGYDRIPLTLLRDELPPQRGNRDLDLEERARDVLVAAGLQEIVSYALTTPAEEARLLPGAPADARPYVSVANPISAERTVMRHSLLPALLNTLAQNLRHHERVVLFEINKIYLVGEEGQLPDEPRRVTLGLAGRRLPPYWAAPDEGAGFDFFDLKGIVETLLAALAVPGASFAALEAPHPVWHPRRSAALLLGERQAGVLGELHPHVRAAFDIPGDGPVLVADLDFDALLAGVPGAQQTRDVPRYPAVTQDLAVVVDMSIAAAQVEAVIRKAGGGLLQSVRLFDVYTGAPVPAGKRSLAYNLTFQAPDRTLTDAEVAKVHGKIVRRLGEELGAVLR